MSNGLWICYVFLVVLIGTQASLAAPPGFVEGHLNIVSLKEVELAHDDGPPVTPKAYPKNYGEYPLIILSKEGQREVARATADERGNFRVSLSPGNYILDIQGRGRGPVRAKPQPFTVASGQTVRVDMDLDTGIR
ncbi:MAG: hypothetical protein DME45_06020 [Verrucomicrobia bacterium]|nr:MAG: hypothetical protein DME45_06020 [Verrucomicrobiota bacterium]